MRKHRWENDIRNKLLIIAKNIKRKYYKKYYDDIPLQIARKFRDELRNQGYKANIAFGRFRLDRPSDERLSYTKIEDFENPDDYIAEIECPVHFWVIVPNKEGKINIDLTADIFNHECDEKFPNIIVWMDEDDRHIFKNYFYV